MSLFYFAKDIIPYLSIIGGDKNEIRKGSL